MKKIVIVASAFALLFTTSCGSEKKEHEEHEKYEATSPLVTDTMITKEYVCQIKAIQHIELRALEKGYLQDIYVDEGQPVKKGDLMFKIMPLLYQAELQEAQAEANYAEVEYLNAKSLADSNVISNNQLKLIKAKYDKAKAALALFEVRLSFTEIRAPFDGLMDRFQVRLGSLLDEGDLLSTLSDINTLWVYFNVPEAEYLDYKSTVKGDSLMKVKLRMANHEMFDQEGVVQTIEADFNNETGNIAFRATFQNPEGLLRHGETGNILLTVPLKNAMLIPQKATFEVLDKKYVYVIGEDNKLITRKIEVEAEMPDLYAIRPGSLNINDKILLEGLRKVKDGDEVEYEFEEPSEVLSHLQLHAE